MTFPNANSFKAKMKKIAREKGIPAQQVQQNYLIEEFLRLIARSDYKANFIIKGGYLISQFIGLDKRTTMDLDVSLKQKELSEEHLKEIFSNLCDLSPSDGFRFEPAGLTPIRKENPYGGFTVKMSAHFAHLKEVIF